MVTSALVTLRLTCLSGFLANDANCRPRVTQTARFRVTSPSRVASRSGSDGPGPVWFGIASPPSGAISHRLAQRSNPIRRGFASFGTTHESHLARFHSADPAGVAMRHAAGAREGGKGVRGGRAGMSARSCGRVCFACDLDREKVSCVCEGGGGGNLEGGEGHIVALVRRGDVGDEGRLGVALRDRHGKPSRPPERHPPGDTHGKARAVHRPATRGAGTGPNGGACGRCPADATESRRASWICGG